MHLKVTDSKLIIQNELLNLLMDAWHAYEHAKLDAFEDKPCQISLTHEEFVRLYLLLLNLRLFKLLLAFMHLGFGR